MLLFFSVARSASTGQAERANEAKGSTSVQGIDLDLPTDKLVDITPQALRMSSPFNAGYWLSAA